MEEVYVVDSHALLWFITEDRRLSPVAEQIMDRAEVGEVRCFVPTIALAEIDRIIRKKNLPMTIDEVLATIATGDGFAAIAFDLEIFQIMLTMPEHFEMHDRIIAATARYSEAKLITRDEVLRNSEEVETVWD